MENFDEAIELNKWLLELIRAGEIYKNYENYDDVIFTIMDTIEFLKWAKERFLELEKE